MEIASSVKNQLFSAVEVSPAEVPP